MGNKESRPLFYLYSSSTLGSSSPCTQRSDLLACVQYDGNNDGDDEDEDILSLELGGSEVVASFNMAGNKAIGIFV